MLNLDFHPSGRHFLQIPGPSPVPDRILRAMSLPTIDHRGPEFGALGLELLAKLKQVFKTEGPVMIYPASGTGAWEAALANVLSPGDRVLMYETGHFAALWHKMALRLQLEPEFIGLPGYEGWRQGVQADMIEARLAANADPNRATKPGMSTRSAMPSDAASASSEPRSGPSPRMTRRACGRMPNTGSRRSAWCTTRPPPA